MAEGCGTRKGRAGGTVEPTSNTCITCMRPECSLSRFPATLDGKAGEGLREVSLIYRKF